MKLNHYQKIVRLSAIYDLIVTFPFAMPIVSVWMIGAFSLAHNFFGLKGDVPSFEGSHMLFVNLMGCIVTVWSVLRILRPEAIFGLFDSFGRFSFASWQLFYLVNHQVTPLLWALFVPELIWGIVQAYGYWLVSEKKNAPVRNCKIGNSPY
jgi:hypothetical protein